MHKVRGHKANKFLYLLWFFSPFAVSLVFLVNLQSLQQILLNRSQVFTLPKVNEKVLIRSASSAGIICPQGMARI